MRGRRSLALSAVIRRLLRALALACCLGQAATAEEIDLARDAKAAFAAGQVELARMLALAVLSDAPRDPTALAVLAAVGLATQEPAAAREVARRSFRWASDKRGKFTAARLAARASVDLGQSGVAKYWLRRAVQVAPDAAARGATVRDFMVLRSQSRLRFDLSLSITPSDNVNNGAETDLLTVDGQPTWFYFDSSTMALSGVETTANMALRYRIAGTAAAPTEIGLRAAHHAVTLSDAAKERAPEARGSDFANSAVDLFLSHKMALGPDRMLSAGLSFGTTWLAGEVYADRVRADLALTTALDKDTQTRFGLAAERQWLAAGGPAATAFSLDAGVQRRLPGGDVVALRLDIGQTVSEDRNQENRRIGASLRYALGKPVAGARLSADLSVTARDYPVFFNDIFNDSGRQDVSVAASLDIALPGLGLFGFEPVLSLEASKTRSNVSRYTGHAAGIGLQIQSSF
jgi:hypothetical protein